VPLELEPGGQAGAAEDVLALTSGHRVIHEPAMDGTLQLDGLLARYTLVKNHRPSLSFFGGGLGLPFSLGFVVVFH